MTAVAVRPVPASPPEPGEIQPVEHEALHRTITGLVTGLPVLALGLAVWQAWDGLLRPGDLVVFAIVYVLTGLGVTVGFHRLFTHRSFKAHPAVRATLAVLGSAAIEGPAISWVADHRKHHAFSDRLGDPHSPHVDHGVGLAGRAARPAARPHGLAVPPRPARIAGALRARPARRPDDALRRPHLHRVGAGRPGAAVRARAWRSADRCAPA